MITNADDYTEQDLIAIGRIVLKEMPDRNLYCDYHWFAHDAVKFLIDFRETIEKIKFNRQCRE